MSWFMDLLCKIFWSARRRSLEQPQDQKGGYHHRCFGRSFRARLCEWSNKQALNLFVALCLWMRMKWMSMTWTALLKIRVVVGRARWHSSPFRLMLILNEAGFRCWFFWEIPCFIKCRVSVVSIHRHGIAFACSEDAMGAEPNFDIPILWQQHSLVERRQSSATFAFCQ